MPPASRPARVFHRDPSAAIRQIAGLWERFVSTGDLATAAPRPVIAETWRRCRASGIDPTMQRAPDVMSPEEIEATVATSDIGQAGSQVLDTFGPLAEGMQHVIVLADRSGRIIHSAGHRGIQDALEGINFRPGADWSEGTVGPNGVGTPIAIGHPELIFGPEHFCTGWQPWVCYGAPIRNPITGDVLGGVDVTGPASKQRRQAFVFTVSLARSIEQVLRTMFFERRHRLLEAYLDSLGSSRCRHAILVDHEGRVIEATAEARALLGISAANCRPIVPAPWAVSDPGPGPTVTTSGRDDHALREQRRVLGARGEIIGAVLSIDAVQARGARRPLAAAAPAPGGFERLLGAAPLLRAALDLGAAAAPSDETVLVIGETGTGKELLAEAIHRGSRRAAGPFVTIDCAALPRELVESELFGYAPGTFTGARREGAKGKFEIAHGGSVFLDEVESLPEDVQAKFLRALETRRVVPLGVAAPVPVDVRIIAAAGAELRERVRQGTFRLDLFHRLCVVEIRLPPLRERPGDVRILVRTFLESQRPGLAVEPDVLAVLERYPWPGNVRELANLCRRWAVTLHGSRVTLADVPPDVREGGAPAGADTSIPTTLRAISDNLLRRTVAGVGGDVAEAARRLGVARSTVYRRLRRAHD